MRKTFLMIAGVSCAAVIAVACGDDDAVPNATATPDSGSITTNPIDSGSTINPTDGGDDDAGTEDITDGGTNIDPDAGDDDDDAGPDAAACNALQADAAPKIASKCSSQITRLVGGALVAGTYLLQRVDDLGPPGFCANQFTPVAFAEQLVLTVDGSGVGTAETVTEIAKRKPRTSTLTLDPGTGKTPLSLTPTCPAKDSSKTPYTSAIKNDKQILVLELPYGQGGSALFHFEKQ